MSKIVLLSVRPRHATNLLSGSKKVELRRVRPRLKEGDIVLLYVAAPIKELRGRFEVEMVVTKPVDELWNFVQDQAGVSIEEFYNYYEDATVGTGIFLRAPAAIINPINLTDLRKIWDNFHPPRTYKYLTLAEFQAVRSTIGYP